MRTPKFQRGFIQFLPIIGAGIAAAASHINTNRNNNANEAMSREQMSFNAAEAEKQRAFSAQEAATLRSWQADQAMDQRLWSEQMSATSYQRAIGDLEKAGLNPMLAYSQGGAPMPMASAPQGAMGQGGAASYNSLPARQSSIQAGIASAAQALSLANLAKTGDNIDADTALKVAQANKEASSSANLNAQTQDILYKLNNKVPEEINELKTRQGTQFWEAAVRMAQFEVEKLEKNVRQEKISTQQAETEYIRIQTALHKLMLPQARNAANAQDSWWMENVSPYLPDILKSTGAAGGLRGLAR